jgi:hypothetical protein
VTPSNEELGAYVDGQLEPETRALVDEAIARDPAVAARVASLRALNDKLRGAFGAALAEPVPARLFAAVRDASPSTVVDLEAARAAKRRPAVVLASPRGWTALAASVVVGLIVGHFAFQRPSKDLLELDANGLAAGPVLSAALTGQLAGDPPSGEGIAIGISFRNRGGSACRTFSVSDRSGLAGIACRNGNGWQIDTLAGHAAPSQGPAGYRQAATSLAPAIRDAVVATIGSEPFDADAERLARERDWR